MCIPHFIYGVFFHFCYEVIHLSPTSQRRCIRYTRTYCLLTVTPCGMRSFSYTLSVLVFHVRMGYVYPPLHLCVFFFHLCKIYTYCLLTVTPCGIEEFFKHILSVLVFHVRMGYVYLPLHLWSFSTSFMKYTSHDLTNDVV